MTKVGGGGALRHVPRSIILVPLVAIVAALLAGCGGGSGAASTTTTSSTPTSGGSKTFQAYAACLARNGVKFPAGGFRPPSGGATTPSSTPPSFPSGSFPSGGFGGGGGFRNNPAFQKAAKACASLRPAGGFFGGGGGLSTAQASALRTYLNCLEIHGLKVPSGTGAPALSFLRTLISQPTAADKAAESACASLRPRFPGRHRPATPTTTTTVA
jgi:hypothetical protein